MNVFTGSFVGDGSGLENVSATATGLATGTYAEEYHFPNTLNQFTGTFVGDGSGLLALDASQLAGVVPPSSLPS